MEPQGVLKKEISQLRQSVLKGDLTKVKNLVANGVDLYEKFRGCCVDPDFGMIVSHAPIHCAIFFNQVKILEFFIQNGIDVNHSSFTLPLLSVAFVRQSNNRSDSWDLIKKLVENGCNVNFQGNFDTYAPLHWAALLGSLEIVQYLVARGAKISPLCKYNWTPLNIAIYKKHETLAKYLIENGSDLTNITKPVNFASGKFEKTSVLKMTFTEGLPALTDLVIEKLREKSTVKGSKTQFESCEFSNAEDFLKNKKECVVCTKPKDGIYALVPCGHTKTCYVCCVILTEATNNAKCPMCREKIEKFMKIYL